MVTPGCCFEEANTSSHCQFVEQRLRRFEVCRIETLREPGVDVVELAPRKLATALDCEQARKTRRRTKLQGTLRAAPGDRHGLAEALLRLLALVASEQQIALNPLDLRGNERRLDHEASAA